MRDFLQAASNTAADTVAAPVDLIAFLLRKAGVPVPQNAVGGTQWMTERGLRRDVQQSPASLAGETVGLLSPVAAAAKAPQIARGLLQVEANAAAPKTLRPEAGAIVWHGSPHKFDRFDASKIGTGEGAQAYGHGLYLAESPDVATSYKNLVQRDPNRLMVDGKVVSPDTMYGRAAEDVARIGVKATLQKIDDNIRFNEKYAPDMAAMYRDLRTKIEALEPTRVSLKEGNLYKVDLPDEKIARMLDWDKPLIQQPEGVREALYSAAPGRYLTFPSGERRFVAPPDAHMTGEAAYARAARLIEAGDSKASERLRELGIPGIRYLDEGSRAKGQGTSNFVVFPGEEQYLRILERNGGLLSP